MAEEMQAEEIQFKRKGWGWMEYLVLLVLIGIVIIGILFLLGGRVSGVYSNVNPGSMMK